MELHELEHALIQSDPFANGLTPTVLGKLNSYAANQALCREPLRFRQHPSKLACGQNSDNGLVSRQTKWGG